jgi:hypothetical protein
MFLHSYFPETIQIAEIEIHAPVGFEPSIPVGERMRLIFK